MPDGRFLRLKLPQITPRATDRGRRVAQRVLHGKPGAFLRANSGYTISFAHQVTILAKAFTGSAVIGPQVIRVSGQEASS